MGPGLRRDALNAGCARSPDAYRRDNRLIHQMNTEIQGEESLIQEFLAPLAAGFPGAFGLKDDCAALAPTPGHDLIVKTDPVAAGVHFFAGDAPEDIAWKALAVNVSDLAAKAAIPRAYLMALSFPEAPTRDWMQRFAQGLGKAQNKFGMHLIGGDTDKRPGPLTISMTVFGEVAAGCMVRRGTAQVGDQIYVTGALGSAAIGLALRGDPGIAVKWGLSANEASAALQRYLRPEPRLALRAALAHASAAMDLSDGLAKDLGRMCRASGVAARISLAMLPLESFTRKAVTSDPRQWQAVAAAGDDYEVLATVPQAKVRDFVAAAQASGTAVSRIGSIARGAGVEIAGLDGKPVGFDRTGWDHF